MSVRVSNSKLNKYEVFVACINNGGQWTIEIEASNHRDAYERTRKTHNVRVISTTQLIQK